MLKCKFCGKEMDSVYEYVSHQKYGIKKLRDAFSKKIALHNGNKVEILKFLYESKKQGKIIFKYSMSEVYNIIWILDAETKTELYNWNFSYGLGWMHDAIFEYWNDKCAKCKITEDEAITKYGRVLELHHIIPKSFYDDMSETIRSPLEMFEPRCCGCHPRGYQ